MSDAIIASLQRRIDELTGENATLKSEAKNRRIAGKKAGQELADLRKDHDALVKDRDSWKGKAEAAPSDLAEKVKQLEGQIRDGKHRSAFAKAAEAAGVEPKAVEDLWTLSGYKAEADEPDAPSIERAIAGAKEARPYLFRPAGEGQGEGQGQPAKEPLKLKVPVDNSRGSGQGAGPTAFRVTSANLQDLGWMQANAARINEARAAGTLVYE